MSIARNLVLNHWNRAKVTLPLLEEEPSAETTENDPFECLLKTEEKAWVRNFIKAMPPKQGQCLKLYAQNLKYREIAENLNLNLETVKSHIFKARSTAKRILAEREQQERPGDRKAKESQ